MDYRDHNFYPGFEHDVQQVKRFLQAYWAFTILLADGRIVHYEPENNLDFHQWLVRNGVKDVRSYERSRLKFI